MDVICYNFIKDKFERYSYTNNSYSYSRKCCKKNSWELCIDDTMSDKECLLHIDEFNHDNFKGLLEIDGAEDDYHCTNEVYIGVKRGKGGKYEMV